MWREMYELHKTCVKLHKITQEHVCEIIGFIIGKMQHKFHSVREKKKQTTRFNRSGKWNCRPR